jgi:hypothetical protein
MHGSKYGSFDHLVGGHEQFVGHGEPKRLGGLSGRCRRCYLRRKPAAVTASA